MKQQVIAIHGGNTFASRQDFFAYLENKTISLDDLRPHADWKAKLQEQLGDQFEVLLPRMPTKFNAGYQEWSIWFEKILSLVNSNAIFIGHSLGGVFLAKYFSEHTLPHKIRAVLMVAAPYEVAAPKTLADFAPSASLDQFAKQVESIHLFFSEDDQVISVGDLEKYQRAIPGAIAHRLNGYGHFNNENFPEIISIIKSL